MKDNLVKDTDRICRVMLDLKLGQNVMVVFNKGGYIKGEVAKDGEEFLIGDNRLNGYMVKGVHLINF